MIGKIFRDDAARDRMESWYHRFLARIDAPSESMTIPTSHGTQHLLTVGDRSLEPLVCLHAMRTSSAHLASELTALLDRFYLLTPDLPGQSPRGLPLHLSYTDDTHAHWLKEILDELHLDRVHLMGVSLGGFAARNFATRYPDRVKSLILVVPAGVVQGSLVKGFAQMALPMIRYRFHPSEKNLQKLVNPLLTTWDDEWARYHGNAFLDFKPHLKIPPLASDEDLQGLTMPCLVIGAENDISFPGKPLIDRIYAQIPHAETELLEDSRHSPPTTPEFREWLGQRVKAFIPY